MPSPEQKPCRMFTITSCRRGRLQIVISQS
jgi:hypothetical protein